VNYKRRVGGWLLLAGVIAFAATFGTCFGIMMQGAGRTWITILGYAAYGGLALILVGLVLVILGR
jgi:hypothetical protein